MKTPTLPLIATLLVIFLAGCSKPDFDTTSGSGGNFSQGKWLIINYWATWCGPCREEIPDLNALAAQRDDIKIYGVNYDNLRGDALKDAITEMGIQFDSMLVDPSPQLAVPRPKVLPTTLLISPAGAVSETLTGPQTTEMLNAALLKAKALQP